MANPIDKATYIFPIKVTIFRSKKPDVLARTFSEAIYDALNEASGRLVAEDEIVHVDFEWSIYKRPDDDGFGELPGGGAT